MKLKHLGVIAMGLLAANAMACYTVYDRSNRVAYQGENPPVDMSLPLHAALQARFPGGHMVFEQTAACAPLRLGDLARPAGQGVAPNTIVFDNGRERRVAVVRTGPVTASRTVVPNTAMMGAGPASYASTGASTMAPRSVARQGNSPLLTDRRTADSMRLPYTVLSGDIVVVPAHAAARVDLPTMTVIPSQVSAATPTGDTVITELHNPPLTVVQRDGETLISER